MAKPYKLDAASNPTDPGTLSLPLGYMSAASGLISTVMDLAKYDVAIDRDLVYSSRAKQQIWTPREITDGRDVPVRTWLVCVRSLGPAILALRLVSGRFLVAPSEDA